MAAFTTIALVALAVGAAASAYSAHEQAKAGKEAAREQRRQAELEKRRADIQNARSIRNTIRQSRIAQAQMENMSANTGTLQSTGYQGGTASLQSQLGGNLSYFGQQQELSQLQYQSQVAMSGIQSKMGSAQAIGAYGQAASSVGKTMFGAYGMA